LAKQLSTSHQGIFQKMLRRLIRDFISHDHRANQVGSSTPNPAKDDPWIGSIRANWQ